MTAAGIDAVPFAHPDLSKWRRVPAPRCSIRQRWSVPTRWCRCRAAS
jgi:hypothetical protein